jgi:threonyl-tRNA synthetase
MIHLSIAGSLERFLSVYIEHTAGAFPTWMSPLQARVLPVSEKHTEYGQSVVSALKNAGVRVDIDDANESLGKKIRNGKTEKIPYLLVVGDKEVGDGTVTVESRTAKIGPMSTADFLTRIQKEIQERT